MSATNAKVGQLLRQYAAALSVEGANRYKIKAYRRAAETIEGLHQDVGKLVVDGGDLTELPGVGKAISEIILEIIHSGKLDRLQRTISEMKPELMELATRPRLDVKKVLRIYKKLGIQNLKQLQQSVDEGKVREEFGASLEYHIRRGLDDRPRFLLYDMQRIAKQIENYLRSLSSVSDVSPVGSLRRKQDTIGDLNYLVTGKSGAQIFQQFSEFGGVQTTEERGKSEQAFHLSSDVTVNLRWTRPAEWGLGLILATGAAPHLDELTNHLQEKKMKLTAASLRAKRIDLSDERALYEGIGLQYIEPELREGRGEVAAAAREQLPKLLELDDILGDLHMHTTASDGSSSIADMAAAAQTRGYKFIAITDHSQSLKITNGLTEKRLLDHIREIDKVNKKLKGFRILKSAEVDILEDGRLDYSDDVLKELDFTICSIHSRFRLDRQQQTERVLRAMDNPYFTILGHATGRLLLKREGYELDMPRIIYHAKAVGCFFEINSSPDRLDLSDENAKLAMERGILIAVNTDAHSIGELNFMSAGVQQARRAWLRAADVLNTRPVEQLLKLLQKRRA